MMFPSTKLKLHFYDEDQLGLNPVDDVLRTDSYRNTEH
jgi:hypothetical protein